MFGALGTAAGQLSTTFLSQAAIYNNIPQQAGLSRLTSACKNTRQVTKNDMVLNDWQPTIEVDSQTYEVRANGELLTCEPLAVLPLAQLYNLF
jgi:urease subunit alpha